MFKLPKLPYAYDALEPYIDKKTMTIHHDKHHAIYLNNLNNTLQNQKSLSDKSIEDLIKEANKLESSLKNIIINQGGGYYNHNLFWKFMTPTKSSPIGNLLKNLNTTFGSLDTFKEKFTQAAVKHFGSGWAWLTTEKGKLEIITTNNQNSPLTKGKVPILGVDVWEHAYYLKYHNRRADYIDAWWNVVNWQEVVRNFDKLNS